jgi:hypothetical protein
MANSSFSIDYERITRPKRGRPYPFKCRICGAPAACYPLANYLLSVRSYKCRICGAPAAWKETFASRDRKRRLISWCICDKCYRHASEHTGRTTDLRLRSLP